MSGLPGNSQPSAPKTPGILAGGLEKALRSPLPFSLGPADVATTEKIMAAARQQHVLIESLWQLFLAPHPPVELLILVRDFAKRHLASHASPLSNDEARLIYLASIAAAFVGSATKITSLSDADLLRLLHWAIHLPQTPPEFKSLFQTAAKDWSAAGPATKVLSEDAGITP